MYKYFGINIKEQEINYNVPCSLKEMLEQHPELWSKITDIKFEDGTTVHQKNGKFNNYEYENAEEYRRRILGSDYSVNDENYSCYSVKLNDIEEGKGPEGDHYYFKTSMSFIDGRLQSTKPLDDKYKEIGGIELPSIILKNGKSHVQCMTMMWHDKGKLHSFRNFPSIVKNKPAIYDKGHVWNLPVTYQLQYHNNGEIDKHFDFYPLDYENRSREPYRCLYNILTNIETFQNQYLKIIENGDDNDFFNIENIQKKHHGLGSNLCSYIKYYNYFKTCKKTLNCRTKVKDIHNGRFRGYITDNKNNEIYLTNDHKLVIDPIFVDSEITYKNEVEELHREDGPAKIVKNYKDKTISCEYYLDDIEYSSYEEIKEELKRRWDEKLKIRVEELIEEKKIIEESVLYDELYL